MSDDERNNKQGFNVNEPKKRKRILAWRDDESKSLVYNVNRTHKEEKDLGVES